MIRSETKDAIVRLMLFSSARSEPNLPRPTGWILLTLSVCTPLALWACTPPPAAECPPQRVPVGAVHHHGEGVPPAGPDDLPSVVRHSDLRSFENNGNVLTGIATPQLGAHSFEVWRTSVAPGSQTPLHRHESEEIFVFLRGEGRAEIGGKSYEFTAPATVIAPAQVSHQFFNTGTIPTDAIVIVQIGSTILDAKGTPMDLPWRK